MQVNLFSFPIIIGIGFTSFLMRLVAHRNRGRVVSIFMLFSGLVILYSLFFITTLLSSNPTIQIFAFHLMVFTTMFIPPAILFFLVEYLGYDSWINWKSVTFLLLVPVISGLLELTDPLHGLFWEEVKVIWYGGFSYVQESPGFIPILLSIYLYFILGISIALLCWGMFQTPRYRRSELNLVIVALAMPLLFDLVRIIGYNPLPHLYMTPYGVLISVVLLGVSIIGYDFLNVIPAAYSRLFSEVKDAILVFDHKMNILDFNVAARHLFFSKTELHERLSHKDLPVSMQNALLDQKTEISIQIQHETKYFDMRISELAGKDGVLRSMLVTLHDISWRKESEFQLQELIKEKEALLGEKEVLIREINHRVKNNFNLAGSLLFLESQKFEDQSVKDAFDVSRDRLRLMSLLNEKLYRSENINNLELGVYLRSIAEDLIRLQWPRNPKVDLSCEADEVAMNPREAIPCGLIVNELVTNSLKHAFGEMNEQRSTISIKLSVATDGLIQLKVEDNGCGFNEGFNYQSNDTLGLKLVHMLGLEQLGGKVDIGNESGACFKISFFANQEDKRV